MQEDDKKYSISKKSLIKLIIKKKLTLEDVRDGITYLNNRYTQINSIEYEGDWLLWKRVLDENRTKFTDQTYENKMFLIGGIYEGRKINKKNSFSPIYFSGQAQGDSMLKGPFV